RSLGGFNGYSRDDRVVISGIGTWIIRSSRGKENDVSRSQEFQPSGQPYLGVIIAEDAAIITSDPVSRQGVPPNPGGIDAAPLQFLGRHFHAAGGRYHVQVFLLAAPGGVRQSRIANGFAERSRCRLDRQSAIPRQQHCLSVKLIEGGRIGRDIGSRG